MIGIYHNRDLDGYASGAIIKKKFPEAKMIGYDYGLPLELPVTGEPVIMADISAPMKTMLKISQLANFDFTWIDHHISAIDEYNDTVALNEPFLIAVLDNTISACEGTWKHLYPNQEIPYGIRLLGEYDTWRNQDKQRWEKEILPFQFGMRLYCNSLETFPDFIFTASEEDIENIIHQGDVVLKYQAQQNEVACRKSAFEFEFEGLRAVCLNGGGFNSDVFKSVYDEAKHDLMVPFCFNGKFWVVSLYTTKDIDCSALAKSKGGGGHKKAAGFQVNDITTLFPFMKP